MEYWNNILQLPNRCLLNKKITKAFFKRNFDLTITERSLLDKQIENIDWLASLNPANTNIPVYQNEDLQYEEIQVIIVNTNNFKTEHFKIAELIHKYIPYAVLLAVCNKEEVVWSTFNKRINQNDTNKRIIEKRFFTDSILIAQPSLVQNNFLNSLNFSNLNKSNLYQLYSSYTQSIFALQASTLNGTFTMRTQSRTAADILLLERMAAIQQEIDSLSIAAKKEIQLNKQIYINLQIQQKRKEIAQLKSQIVAE